MRLSRWLLTSMVAVASTATATADVKLHPLFCDDMVLQRDIEAPVWGTADPGESVEVNLMQKNDTAGGWGSVTIQNTKADDKGKWIVKIPAQKADGKTYSLTVKGKNTLNLKNVAIGDVWICSGQSNMEWTLRQLPKEDQGKKVAEKATNPNIRLFTVQKTVSMVPLDTVKVVPINKEKDVWAGKWQPCNPDTAYFFSAVGYFFGRDLNKALNVPIGLISTNWGGTVCEAWCSKESLNAEKDLAYFHPRMEQTLKTWDPDKAEKDFQAAMDKHRIASEKAKAEGKPAPQAPRKAPPPTNNPNLPSVLYNGMIAPLLPFAIKGAIWYQGESNASRAYEYRTLFPTMIKDWRKAWGYDLPFFAVQLAPFRADGSEKVSYAELRDAQFHASKVLPKVGTAVISDVGDETDIHPQQKEPVGARLALAARAIAYGEKIEYSGPVYKSHKVEGKTATVLFDHAAGLKTAGDTLTGFTMCGEDKVFHPAMAKIVGDTVVVTSDKVEKPIAVRFGWVNFAKPTLNFFNGAGLPAVPFRTDDFPLTTMPKK